MNAFVGKCNTLICLLVVIVFAFAEANSQSNFNTSNEQLYTITPDFDRAQLFELIKELKTDQQFEVRLTAYSRNENQLKELGIAVKPMDGDWVEFSTQDDAGIAPVCLKVIEGKLNSFSMCDPTMAVNQQEEIIEPVVEQTISKNSIVTVESSTQESIVPQKNITAREKSLLLKDEQRRLRAEQYNDRVEEIKMNLAEETDSIKIKKSETKAQLKDLQIEVNRSRRERTTLASSNQREKAKRDSLQAQQDRLQLQMERQQQQLEQMIAQQKANEELIKQQQQVIEEQGLKAETAESLKAYRTALEGDRGDEKLKSKGYLIFASEQCLYKVYDGYSIVYGNQGNFLFTINKELSTTPLSGELKIKGKQFVYNYSGNVLFIKDSEGELVNEHGEVLSTTNRF